MSYKIVYTSLSISDINNIGAYLTEQDDQAPIIVLGAIKAQIEQLRFFPLRYPVYDGEPDFRKMPVGNYIVFYMVNETEKSIIIARVFHSSRNIEKTLVND